MSTPFPRHALCRLQEQAGYARAQAAAAREAAARLEGDVRAEAEALHAAQQQVMSCPPSRLRCHGAATPWLLETSHYARLQKPGCAWVHAGSQPPTLGDRVCCVRC
jgi:hypothetical protein